MDYNKHKQSENNNNLEVAHENVLVHTIMKKMILGFTLISAMAMTVATFANSKENSDYIMSNYDLVTNVSMQGSHCTGTVGCSCSGFSPITDGEVWQQAYCKRCGHKKNCHK